MLATELFIGLLVSAAIISLTGLRLLIYLLWERHGIPVDGPVGMLTWLLCCINSQQRAAPGASAAPTGRQQSQEQRPPTWMPLPDDIIAALPVFYIPANKACHDMEMQCPICQDDYKPGSTADPPASLPCGHVFHRNCIQKWLSRKASCPLCQMELTPRIMEEHIIDAAFGHGRAVDAAAAKLLSFQSDLRPRDEMPNGILQTASSIETAGSMLDSARSWRPKQRAMRHSTAPPCRESSSSPEPSERRRRRRDEGFNRSDSGCQGMGGRDVARLADQRRREQGQWRRGEFSTPSSQFLDSAELEIDYSALSAQRGPEQMASSQQRVPVMTHLHPGTVRRAALVSSAALQLAMLRAVGSDDSMALPEALSGSNDGLPAVHCGCDESAFTEPPCASEFALPGEGVEYRRDGAGSEMTAQPASPYSYREGTASMSGQDDLSSEVSSVFSHL